MYIPLSLNRDYTKVKNNPIISEEVKTARKVMRDKFTHADMGVSGANVAVAETGTVFTMTNEGNGRMVGIRRFEYPELDKIIRQSRLVS